MASISKDSETAGMKWDDLIMNFETIIDLKNLLESDDLNKDQKVEVEEAMVTQKKWIDCRVV